MTAEWGPGHPEWCPAERTKAGEPNADHSHCDCWWECEPCCRCGDDADSPGCDCPKHNPGLYDDDGKMPNITPEARS